MSFLGGSGGMPLSPGNFEKNSVLRSNLGAILIEICHLVDSVMLIVKDLYVAIAPHGNCLSSKE